MISAVIIDDESKARTTLKELLKSVCTDIQVIGEADGVASGLQLLEQTQPDVVFIDIQMNDGTGFDLLDKLPQLDCHIVFATAYEEFAIKAFRYHAMNYLTKPIDPDDLLEVCQKVKANKSDKLTKQNLDRLMQSMQHKKIENITLSTNEGLIFLRLKDIIHLQSDGNYTYFHTKEDGRVMVSRILREFDNLLPEDLFFRTHQSHIVNIQEVRKFLREDGGYALMSDGAKVPVSRRKKEDFLDNLQGLSL